MKLKAYVFVAFFVAILLTSQLPVQAEDTAITFPSVTGYFEGDVLVSTTTLTGIIDRIDMAFKEVSQYSQHYPTIQAFLESVPMGYQIDLDPSEGLFAAVKVSTNTWSIRFSTETAAAPVLDQATTTTSPGEIGVVPQEREESDKDMGLPFFVGDSSYILKNETGFQTTTYEYPTDFAVVPKLILALYNVQSLSTSNISVTVSYVNSTSVPNLNSTYAVNKTLFNDFVRTSTTLWWRLDLENTQNAYVAHVKITNIDVLGGIYIYTTTADARDSRYSTIYIGDRTSPDYNFTQTLNSIPWENWEKIEVWKQKQPSTALYSTGDPDVPVVLNGFWTSITPTQILTVPSKIRTRADNVINEARGWNSASDLQNSIKKSVAAKLSINPEELTLDKITKAAMGWAVTPETAQALQNTMDKAAEVSSDVKTVINTAQEKTLKRIHFATEIAADAIKNTAAAAKDVKDITTGIFATAKAKATQFATDIKDNIVDATGKIVHGAVSVVSKAKQFVTEGMNWLLVLGGILAVIVVSGAIIYLKFLYRR